MINTHVYKRVNHSEPVFLLLSSVRIIYYYAFCKFLLLYKFIRYFGIYHKELYSVDILCENRTSSMPISRGEGWVFSCLSKLYIASPRARGRIQSVNLSQSSKRFLILVIVVNQISNFTNLYIYKALDETKNILTLSRLSDPIYQSPILGPPFSIYFVYI